MVWCASPRSKVSPARQCRRPLSKHAVMRSLPSHFNQYADSKRCVVQARELPAQHKEAPIPSLPPPQHGTAKRSPLPLLSKFAAPLPAPSSPSASFQRGLFWDKKKISTDWEMVFELLTSRLLGEHGGLGGFQGYFCIKAPCDFCDG